MVYDTTGLYGNGTNTYFHDTRGNLLAGLIGAGTYYYIEDGLGSIVGLTDVSGNVVQSYQYDPYGNLTTSTESVAANLECVSLIALTPNKTLLTWVRDMRLACSLTTLGISISDA